MKILNDDSGSTFAIIIDKKEAQTLIEIVSVACEANKRKSTFKTWKRDLENKLCCF